MVGGGEPSIELPLFPGVPQGLALLFLVYIDDISHSVTHMLDEIMLTLYADDMILYKPINLNIDFSHLQFDSSSIKD